MADQTPAPTTADELHPFVETAPAPVVETAPAPVDPDAPVDPQSDGAPATTEPLAIIPVTTTPDDLSEETVIQVPVRVPGAAVESAEDKAANDVVRAEDVAVTLPEQPARDIDASSPLANLATRDNIVGDGPGTVGEALL